MDIKATRVVNLVPAVLAAFGLYLVWSAVQRAAEPLLLIALSLIVAAGLNPLVVWANARLRLPRAVASAVILFLFLGGLGLLGWLLIPTIVQELVNLINAIIIQAPAMQQSLVEWIGRTPYLSSAASSLESIDLASQIQSLLSAVPATLLGAVGATTGLLSSLLIGVLLLLMGFMVLVQPEPLLRGALAGIPDRYRDDVGRTIVRIGQQLGGWLVATTILSFAMGILVAAALFALTLFGVPVQNIFLFAVIAGVAQIVPVVGGLIGVIGPVLTTLSPHPLNAVWVAIAVLAAEQIVFQVFTPLVLSRNVSLHPASLLAGVLIFSAMFGWVGAFLAVPFLIILKALYEEVYVKSLVGPAVTDAEVKGLLEGTPPPERE